MNKYKIIALFGPSAAGKDTIQRKMVSSLPEVSGIISCTTRPPRENEKDGVDYHFLDNYTFGEKVLNGSMLEATSFRDWFYGTPIESLNRDTINIGVFNIAGIECLLQDSRIDVLPVLIQVDDKDRLLRSLNREHEPDCEEICRRFLTDKKDFSKIDFQYFLIDNSKEYVNLDWLQYIVTNFDSLVEFNTQEHAVYETN